MTEKDEKKFKQALNTKSSIEADFENTLIQLLSGREPAEVTQPIKTAKKIIKTPDSQTTIEYKLGIDPQTGKQEVVVNVTSTKRECSICGTQASSVYVCQSCGQQVCGKHYGTYVKSTQGGGYAGTYIYHDEDVKLCANCYFDRTGKRLREEEKV